MFGHLSGLALDTSGTRRGGGRWLYVADVGNACVRAIDLGELLDFFLPVCFGLSWRGL